MRFVARLIVCLLPCIALPAAAQGVPPISAGAADAVLSGGQGSPTPPPGAPQETPTGFSGNFTAGLGFQKINEDYLLTLDLANTFKIGPVSLGLWVPLSIRVIDKDPDDKFFRTEDWDEVSDFARLIRFAEVRLGGDSWRLRARIGALDSESIGHGTILAGYYNNIDRDHYHGGLALSAALKYGGVELMIDDLLGPSLFAFRVHVRPTSFFSDNPLLNKLAVGISYAGDVDAPLVLNDGDPATMGWQPDLDDKDNYRSTEKHIGVLGFDVEYTLFQNKLLDLVPYADVNILMDAKTGAGLHLGTFFNIRIPTPLGPTVLTRLEYRAVGDGYAPRYFDASYQAQRIMFSPDLRGADDAPLTKIGWLRQGNTGRHGWLGELYLDFAGWVRVGGTYEDYTGPNNSAITLSLIIPKWETVQVGAYYTRRGFEGAKDAFDLDGALMVAFARAKIYGPLQFTLAYSRAWTVQQDGTYQTDDNFSAGIGLSFNY